jgi:hypothetical protein
VRLHEDSQRALAAYGAASRLCHNGRAATPADGEGVVVASFAKKAQKTAKHDASSKKKFLEKQFRG